MHRRPLLALLDRYRRANPDEAAMVERIETLVRRCSDCFERTCAPGHITGSAWITSADGTRVLLTHHKKLDRWLQLGGHADGDPDPRAVAMREAEEESGLRSLRLGSPDILDVDVHTIPARGAEPEHEHHDIRYWLIADPDEPLTVSDESHDLAWFGADRIGQLSDEDSLLRMAAKVRTKKRPSAGGAGGGVSIP